MSLNERTRAVHYNHQNGVAIFYILLAVALFAALSYAFTATVNSASTNNLTKEEARVYAQDILSYANRLSRAVQRVLSRGDCSENDVSFYLSTNTFLSAYQHTPEVDDRCKVFDENGGSITWLTAPQGVNDGSDWIFTGRNRVIDIESNVAPSGNELIALLPFINEGICIEVNDLVNVVNTNSVPPEEASNVSINPFVGVYDSGNDINASGNELDGKKTGCFEASNYDGSASPNTYHFYHVLIAR